MAAGSELSVAATKTFIASLAALLKLVAGWADDASLDAALNRLPRRLAEATHLDWSHAVVPISSTESLIALGRGPTLAIAQEAALKLKEVCNIHAEAYSGAEFQHGPIALVSRDYPILIFSPADKSAESLTALTTELCRKGAAVFTTGHERGPGCVRLPVLKRDHPETDAVCLIQSFYRLAVHLATQSRYQCRPAPKLTESHSDQMTQLELYAVAADYVFDGSTKQENVAVVFEGSKIKCVMPQSEFCANVPTRYLPAGSWLAPGFIDLQVNGGGDVLFNNLPTPEAIATIAAAHRRFGTTALLPTFITDTRKNMRTAIAAAQEAKEKNPSVLGIHLEGPFLAPDKAGVHNPDLIRAPDEADLEMLCAKWTGEMLITLAPERVPSGFIAKLTKAGRRVSLGHSMASYDRTRSAMDEGLAGFTHLFNAMRPLQSREPGPIAAALELPAAWYGLIVDGWHVSPPMLRLALRGCGHPMLVTDAMAPVGGHQPTFQLYRSEIKVVDGRCLRSDGTLAGAALDMAAAVRNCVSFLQVPLADALRFASRNPAEFIGVGHFLGRLAPGYRADMVAIDPGPVAVLATWVAGKEELVGEG